MRKRPTVAEYLTAQIDLCGKTQQEIAQECGFEKSNIITMFKQGKSKLPISRVPAMARALGVDPLYLFQLAFSEYEPDTWAAIEDAVLRQPLLTANEREILEVIRSSKVHDPKLRTAEEKGRLRSFVDDLRPGGAA